MPGYNGAGQSWGGGGGKVCTSSTLVDAKLRSVSSVSKVKDLALSRSSRGDNFRMVETRVLGMSF